MGKQVVTIKGTDNKIDHFGVPYDWQSLSSLEGVKRTPVPESHSQRSERIQMGQTNTCQSAS